MMKRFPWFVTGHALLLIGLMFSFGCSKAGVVNQPANSTPVPSPQVVTQAKFENITSEQAKKLIDEGAQLLDVREPDEFAAGHIPGSILIPLGQLADRVQELDPNKPVIVVCRSGNRSVTGSNILLNKGFTQVMNLLGGIKQWPYQVEK